MLETSHLGGFIIHISNREKEEALKKLTKEGVEDITEIRSSEFSSSYDIYASWRIINGLMERGYLNKQTHDFTLNPGNKKETSKKLFCV